MFAIEIRELLPLPGRLRVIASIEEPGEVMTRILAHQERGCGAAGPERAPIARAERRRGGRRSCCEADARGASAPDLLQTRCERGNCGRQAVSGTRIHGQGLVTAGASSP